MHIKNLFKKKVVYYDSIYTLPIYNWFKIMDKGSLGFLRVDSTLKNASEVHEEATKEAIDIWHSIVDQITDEFGQDETQVDILEKKRDIALLEADYVITGNKFLLTQIDIKKSALAIYDTNKEFDYNKEIGIVSKFLGYQINPKKMSVYEYNNAKNQLKNSTNG